MTQSHNSVTCVIGYILKFFCKLKNDVDQAKAAKELEETVMGFCANTTAATPLIKLVKLASLAETMDNAMNQYEVGFVSTLIQPSQPQSNQAIPSHAYLQTSLSIYICPTHLTQRMTGGGQLCMQSHGTQVRQGRWKIPCS